MYRLILFLFITCVSGIKLYEFRKHPKDQPTGIMNYSKIPQDNFLLNNPIIKL